MRRNQILHNRIQCKKCGDIIESYSVHDFKYCSCRAVAVDGGQKYLRRVGILDSFIDLSETKEIEVPDEQDSSCR